MKLAIGAYVTVPHALWLSLREFLIIAAPPITVVLLVAIHILHVGCGDGLGLR